MDLILRKEMVERNRGKILTESEIGKGSCFNFTLPKPAIQPHKYQGNIKSVYSRAEPHTPRNFVSVEYFAPHFVHSFKVSDAPQLIQNLPSPAGLPH